MKKELITFDQLVALSFLKFVRIDEIDITLVLRDVKDIAEVSVRDDTSEYFIMSDGSVILENRYIDKFYKNVDISLFESLRCGKVLNYFKNLDMFEFMLRKIQLLSNVCGDKFELNNNLSFIQKNILAQLYKKRYIDDYSCKDDEMYESVRLTKRGELYLYLIDNKEKIDEFKKLLEVNGYDLTFLDAFLISQDLNTPISEMLTINNFKVFCDNYEELLKISQKDDYKKAKNKN